MQWLGIEKPKPHRNTRIVTMQLLRREAPKATNTPAPQMKETKRHPPAPPQPKPMPPPVVQPTESVKPLPAPPDLLPQDPALSSVDEKIQAPPSVAQGPEPVVVPEPAAEIQAEEPRVQEAIPLYDINPAPPYPPLAFRRGYQGTVILEVMVNASGAVAEARLLQSSGYPLLDQTALTAIRNWAFRPGTRNGRPVEMRVNVPIVFQLR